MNYNKRRKSSSKSPSIRSDLQRAKVFPHTWSEESPATPGSEPLAVDGKVYYFPHDDLECHAMTSKTSPGAQCTYGPQHRNSVKDLQRAEKPQPVRLALNLI